VQRAATVVVGSIVSLVRCIQLEILKVRYLLWGRPRVRLETTKARPRREREGFFQKYCSGRGLDIGYGGDPLTPDCLGWDIEHGDAQYLMGIEDQTFDFVYSSHTLEHMANPGVALRNWWKAVKPGGHLILYLPHRDLYEKRQTLPSRWNMDHKYFFILDNNDPPDTIGILPLIDDTLSNYEVTEAKECSEGHTIREPERHSDGEYSIEVVIRKLA
jgi:SAM-dependent methyltransferase